MLDRFIPADLAPWVVRGLPNQRAHHPILVRCIAPGKPSLDTGVAVICLPVLVRRHAHHLVALHFRLERAADAAVGAGRYNGVIGLAMIDDALFHQRCCRAGLYAGPAGDTLGIEKAFIDAGRNLSTRIRAPGSSVQTSPELHRRRARIESRRCTCWRQTGSRDCLRRRRRRGDSPRRSRSAHRAVRRRRPYPGARSRRLPNRSGSRADGPKYRVP